MQEYHSTTKPEKIKMYATPGCGDCRMAKRWFDEHSIPYDHINIEEDEHAAAYVLRVNRGYAERANHCLPRWLYSRRAKRSPTYSKVFTGATTRFD